MTVDIILAASRYDRGARKLEKAARKYVSLSHLVLHTEVERQKRKAALRKATPFGWNCLTGQYGNGDDCAVQYDRERLRIRHYERPVLTRKKVKPSGAPIHGVVMVFEDRTAGKSFVVGLAHFPSSVEKYAGRRMRSKARRALAWMQCFRKLKKRVNKLKKKYDCDGALITGDFNMNEKLRAVRATRKVIAPRYKSAWHRLPFFGTFGKRLIEWVLYKGKIHVDAKLLADDDSSDHRPMIAKLTWRNR